jgi:hypothetical protein
VQLEGCQPEATVRCRGQFQVRGSRRSGRGTAGGRAGGGEDSVLSGGPGLGGGLGNSLPENPSVNPVAGVCGTSWDGAQGSLWGQRPASSEGASLPHLCLRQ